MSFARLQSGSGTISSSTPNFTTGALTPGSKIRIVFTREDALGTVTSVVDDATENTYSLATSGRSVANQFAGDGVTYIYYADNVSSSVRTITMNLSASTTGRYYWEEVTGLKTGAPTYTANSGTGTLNTDDILSVVAALGNLAGMRGGTYINSASTANDSTWDSRVAHTSGSLSYHQIETKDDTGSPATISTTFTGTGTHTTWSGAMAFWELAGATIVIGDNIASSARPHPGRGPFSLGKFAVSSIDAQTPHAQNNYISPNGLDSAAAYGSHTVANVAAQGILPSGKSSAAVYGTHTLSAGSISISPSGKASEAVYGSHVVSLASGQQITPGGVSSAAAFGTHAVADVNLNISPSGVASAAAPGAHTLEGGVEPPASSTGSLWGDLWGGV